MAETSFPWDGTSVGDAASAPYDAPTEQALMYMLLSGALGMDYNAGGVFQSGLGGPNFVATSYMATVGVGLVTLDPGSALAYGTFHQNTAGINVAIPTPAASDRTDWIVLRKDWAAQTVRITRLAGAEGGGTGPPATFTQNAGVTWDTPLWKVTITTAAVITLTDIRQFIAPAAWPAIAVVGTLVAPTLVIANATDVRVLVNQAWVETVDSMWEGAVNPNRVTIPRKGIYRIRAAMHSFGVTAGALAAGDIVNLKIYKNGALLDPYPPGGLYGTTGVFIARAANQLSVTPMVIEQTVQLEQSDYIEMFVRQGSGGSISISSQGDPILEVSQVGAAGGVV